jgi:ubiquinone/menaquinone biosynthesis C-methylase UbiE
MSKEPAWLYFPEWLATDTWHFPYACKTICKHIPPGSLVLEIGFGSGRIISRVARNLNCTCVGVEVDDGAFPSLDFFSRQEGVAVEAAKGDGFALPFKDGSFDVVYSEGVIEHFPVESSEAMIREHARVCRPGGLVIISAPNKFALVHSLTKRLLGTRFLFSPEASFSTFQLAGMMSRAGITPIKRDGFAFGCQFYMFQAFFVAQTSCCSVVKGFGEKLLALFNKTKLYHFENQRLNSLIGFQTLVVGQKSTSCD